MLTQITPEIIEEVKNRLVKAYNPLEIYLYGPHAYQPTDPQSDIDFAIIVQEANWPNNFREKIGYKALFGLHVPKTLIVYTQQEFLEGSQDRSCFEYSIKHSGKRIYAKS